jgi:hypothetical protein
MQQSAALTPLLLDAKKEYVARLSDVYEPYLTKYMSGLYKDALKGGASKSLVKFQVRLKAIPSWSAATVSEHTRTIEQKSPFLSDLIAAVFVSYVKVLSSITITDDKPNIRLKLPSNESFTHQLFICVAREYYEHPHLIKESDGQWKAQLVLRCIESTVREMLPLAEILKAYLGSTIDQNHTVSPSLSSATPPPVSQSNDTDEDDEDDDIFASSSPQQQQQQYGLDDDDFPDSIPESPGMPPLPSSDTIQQPFASTTAPPVTPPHSLSPPLAPTVLEKTISLPDGSLPPDSVYHHQQPFVPRQPAPSLTEGGAMGSGRDDRHFA